MAGGEWPVARSVVARSRVLSVSPLEWAELSRPCKTLRLEQLCASQPLVECIMRFRPFYVMRVLLCWRKEICLWTIVLRHFGLASKGSRGENDERDLFGLTGIREGVKSLLGTSTASFIFRFLWKASELLWFSSRADEWCRDESRSVSSMRFRTKNFLLKILANTSFKSKLLFKLNYRLYVSGNAEKFI